MLRLFFVTVCRVGWRVICLGQARLLAHVSNRVQGNDESKPPLLCDVLTALLQKDTQQTN